MSIKFSIIFFAAIAIGCQNNAIDKTVVQPEDTTLNELKVENQLDTTFEIVSSGNNKLLALSTNALMLVDKTTGSTNELLFGMEMGQLIEIINATLQSKVSNTQVNTECGAGPLNFAVWNNGLTIPFQENKKKSTGNNKHWEFAGWFISNDSINAPAVKTMSNIGVGSTKSELEKAYVVSYKKTSIGYEFSTSAGLYGLLSGNDNNAVIKAMWSGVSCIFR